MATIFVIICIFCISITNGEEWTENDKVEHVSQMDPELLTVKINEVINKYEQLETFFQNVLKSNADLQATVVYQASRIEQLQAIAEVVPRLVSEIEGLKSKTRVAENTADDLMNLVVKIRSQSSIKRVHVSHDDWINKIDRETIINIKKEFKKNNNLEKKLRDLDSYQEQDDGDDVLKSETIQMISNALAKLVTEEKQSFNKQIKTRQEEYREAADESKLSNQMSGALMSLTRAKSKSSKKKLAFSLIRTSPLLGNKSRPQIVTFDQDIVMKGKG
ncbi:uncharacterized protein LOC144350709, partial [Saccoglossus kowalevskii]